MVVMMVVTMVVMMVVVVVSVCVCVCVCAGVTPLVGEAGRTAAIETRLSTVHVCV